MWQNIPAESCQIDFHLHNGSNSEDNNSHDPLLRYYAVNYQRFGLMLDGARGQGAVFGVSVSKF